MTIKPYLKPTMVYAAIYVFLSIMVFFIAVTFDFKSAGLRTTALLVSACCAMYVFVKMQGRAPSLKDGIILSLATLGVFYLVVYALRSTANIPFMPSIFIIQTLTHLAISGVAYGYLAPRYVAGIVKKQRITEEKEAERVANLTPKERAM